MGALSIRRRRAARFAGALRRLRLALGLGLGLGFALAWSACAPAGPRPIAYGHESCANCLMTVSDDRFGAELVTRTGKVYAFDSAECLAEYVAAHPAEAQGSLWVTEFDRPGKLVPAQAATYLRTAGISSPMGLGVAALGPHSARPPGVSGEPLTWRQVIALADRSNGAGRVSEQ